jgi:hypothetical protein
MINNDAYFRRVGILPKYCAHSEFDDPDLYMTFPRREKWKVDCEEPPFGMRVN